MQTVLSVKVQVGVFCSLVLKNFMANDFRGIPHGNRLQLQLYTDGCVGTDDHVAQLEHVQAIVTLKAPKRGDLQIYLTSPSSM